MWACNRRRKDKIKDKRRKEGRNGMGWEGKKNNGNKGGQQHDNVGLC